MPIITSRLYEFWQGLNSVIATGGITDILDILVVAYLLYHAIRLVRETRAMQLVKGIAVVLILYLVAVYLEMLTLTVIIRNIVQWGILAVAILFQPELRRALEQVGRSKFYSLGRLGGRETQDMIKVVGQSADILSRSKTGALIAIEREIKLGDFIPSGTVIDSELSMPLICNIFYPNTPLHDGAMILRDGRAYAAGCFLPLSVSDEIGRELGTRHRAAIGLSEVSDAIVIVVSEESGKISVAMNGNLEQGCSRQRLTALLEENLVEQKPEKGKKAFWRKNK